MNERVGGSGDVDAGMAAIAESATRLGRALRARGWRAVTAESCTGGLVAWALTETGGSSEWFERGYVTYSNEAKRDCLAVDERTLDTHGAVSEATAREMAQGALRASRAQLAIAITGVAGPGGGSAEKPVGLVCFGWAIAERVESTTRRFAGDRAAVRRHAAAYALARAQALLEGGSPAAVA